MFISLRGEPTGVPGRAECPSLMTPHEPHKREIDLRPADAANAHALEKSPFYPNMEPRDGTFCSVVELGRRNPASH